MKVVCIGEMLIDFVCTDTGQGLVKGVNYLKKSGGAPANVAACIGKLGAEAHLVGAVGSDPFGEFLISEVKDYKVDTSHVTSLPMSTTLAFVSLDKNGDREFAFNRGADEQLELSQSAIDELTQGAILHLGSATALLGGKLSESYMNIAQAAKQKGNVICFDPNFRIDLWKGHEAEFIEACKPYFAMADVVKVSDEELVLITKQDDHKQGCLHLHALGIKVVLVTLGGDGCLISTAESQIVVPAYEIDVVDTTGAGDSFIGAMLYLMSKNAPGDDFYQSQMADFVAFAGKVSGLVCSKLGAMTALPTLQEVESINFTIKQ